MLDNPTLGDEPRVAKTDIGAKDGQNKCPKCGATDISLNPKTGKLRCNYCRHEFMPEKVEGIETDIKNLRGEIIGSGAKDIQDEQNIKTIKCSSCGAEVVIDTSETTQARCHWCRNTLSINQQISNGVIPDMVLPFKVTKEEAKEKIEEFVRKRKNYANPKFKAEFTADNIMGVYFPYLVVDINAHANLSGRGEETIKRYKNSDDKTLYIIDLYHVERDFDITIEGLTIESSSELLDNSPNKTNNIINSILPFDIENCVKFNSNYLKGYTSEKRDTNINELKEIVDIQSKDITKIAANDSINSYDRGVYWEKEDFQLKGRQWKTAYLPVWLYSYLENKGEKNILHYVAVNARSKETMGSVPLHLPKLIIISFLIELIAIIAMSLFKFANDWLLLLPGIIYFIVIYSKYRNSGARHYYETETKRKIYNMKKVDEYIRREEGRSDESMILANNLDIYGASRYSYLPENIKKKIIDYMEKDIK